jgi:hypothetical protein
MDARAAQLLVNEWKPTFFFVAVISVLGLLSIYFVNNALLKGALYCFGICVYNAYFLYLGKALKGEKITNPLKFILVGKDKARYDFFVLLAFFSAILLILWGPFLLFQTLFMEKLYSLEISSEIVNFIFRAEISIRPLIVLYNIAILIAISIYKISLYAAISSLTYNRHEVLKAFKDGFNGLLKFTYLVGALAAFEIAALFSLWATKGAIQNGVTFISYLIPAAIMFLMSCSYSLPELPSAPQAEPAETMPSASG